MFEGRTETYILEQSTKGMLRPNRREKIV